MLQIGQGLLRERLPKSFKQDVVLAMALAYIDISRDAMALSPPDFIAGCEMLERALKLLQVNNSVSRPLDDFFCFLLRKFLDSLSFCVCQNFGHILHLNISFSRIG